MRVLTAFLSLAFAAGSCDSSAPTATGRLPTPAARSDIAMVYDEARHVTLLFGGGLGDTWTWNGTRWMQVATTGPAPRRLPTLAYDAARSRVVLFGGQIGTTLLSDTWEWDGATWTRRATTGPEARIHQVGAYDRARQRVVIFGGFSAADERLTDTWEWDGASWTRRQEAGPDRWGSAIAFDQARDQLLLLAIGRTSLPDRTNPTDLWSWNGTTWSLVGPALGGPSLSPIQDMTALGAGGGLLLFDGGTLQGASSTWLWHGTTWAKHGGSGPSMRNGTAVAYDADRQRVVLFGGGTQSGDLSDTWEWDGSNWALVNVP